MTLCPGCGKYVRVRKDGLLAKHAVRVPGQHPTWTVVFPPCRWSGQHPQSASHLSRDAGGHPQKERV